jgi:hypothetical protein
MNTKLATPAKPEEPNQGFASFVSLALFAMARDSNLV